MPCPVPTISESGQGFFIMWSYWEKQHFIGKPDLTIVGGGIVGLSAAIHYKQGHPSANVLLIEAGHLPSGASTKNAGFACYGSPSELISDLKHSSPTQVFGLVQRRFEGLRYLRNWLGDEELAYEEPGSYELFGNQQSYHSVCNRLSELNNQLEPILGIVPYHIDDKAHSAFGFHGFCGTVKIKGEGQLNTGLMMKTLIKKACEAGIEIINGLRVSKIASQADGVTITTDHGTFLSSQALVTSNGFASELLPHLGVKPGRAQVLITTPINNLPIKGTFFFDDGYYYFRNVGDRILFGGGRNMDFEKETTTNIDLNDEIQDHLIEILKTQILPNHSFSIDQQWAGIMGFQTQKAPIVKSISDRLHCAVALGGMGVAIGVDVGREAIKSLSPSHFT